MSERIMGTLASCVPKIEKYSIDEAFLDMNGMDAGDLSKLGNTLRAVIKKNIGIPVSIGIAATKTLAKMANRHAKKHYKETSVFWAVNQTLTHEMLSATAVDDAGGLEVSTLCF